MTDSDGDANVFGATVAEHAVTARATMRTATWSIELMRGTTKRWLILIAAAD